MSTLDVLRLARKKLAGPAYWIQGVYAHDEQGNELEMAYWVLGAELIRLAGPPVCFCLSGAVYAAAHELDAEAILDNADQALDALFDVAKCLPGFEVETTTKRARSSDGTTHLNGPSTMSPPSSTRRSAERRPRDDRR